MVNKLLVPLHRVKLLVDDGDVGGEYVGRVPKRLAQPVELGLGVLQRGDALGVDEVIAVDGLDDRVFHGYTSLCVQRVQRVGKVGQDAVASGSDGVPCGDGGRASVQVAADDEILAAGDLRVGNHVIVRGRVDLLDVQLRIGAVGDGGIPGVGPHVVVAKQHFHFGGGELVGLRGGEFVDNRYIS